MALRRRQSIGARVGYGISDAASEFGDTMMKQALQQRQGTEAMNRSLFKDYSDRVTKGEMEPAQAEAALRAQGVRIPTGYFDQLQPSVSSGLEKIVGSMTKAGSPQEVPGPLALSSSGPVRRSPMGFGMPSLNPNTGQAIPPTPDEGQLPSTKMQPFSPELEGLLSVRSEKLNSFAPPSQQTVDASGNKVMQYGTTPYSFAGKTMPLEATPEQAGRNKTTEDVTQAQSAVDQKLGALRGTLFEQQDTAERPSKVATAAATTAATTQAGIDVNTSPANMAKEAQLSATKARADARAQQQVANENPAYVGISSTYIKGMPSTSPTGESISRPYLYLDPAAPAAARARTLIELNAMNKDRASRGLEPIRQVTAAQEVYLNSVQKARADYQQLMDEFLPYLSKDASGRPIAFLRGTLGATMAAYPALKALVETRFPVVISTLKATAGPGGLGRIMQMELQKGTPVLPGLDDTWPSGQNKKIDVGGFLQDGEDSVLGPQNPPPQR